VAHTFDTNLKFNGQNNPLAATYTCGSGATLLCVSIAHKSHYGRPSGAPTYNGVALTEAGRYDSFLVYPAIFCELWYLLDPPTGVAYQLSVPNPNSDYLNVQISSYKATTGYTSAIDTNVTGEEISFGDRGWGYSPEIELEAEEDGDVAGAVLNFNRPNPPSAQSGTELNTTQNYGYSDSNQYTLQAVADTFVNGWTTSTYGEGVYGAGIYNGTNAYCIYAAAFKQTNIDTTVEPTALALSLSLINPAIETELGITVLPVAITLAATLNAPVISIGRTYAATALASTLTLHAPSVSISATILPSVQALSLSVSDVGIFAQQSITIVAPVNALTLTIEGPNILAPLDTVRLIPFIFSSTIAYMTEFGEEYARFYYNGEPLLGGGEVHVEIATDYQSSDLYQLQTKQIADVMWLVHPFYPPAKLKRTTPTTFSLEDIEFEKGPFLERNDIENNDGVTMNVNVTQAGDTGTLTRSAGSFQDGHIGSLFKLAHPRIDRQTSGVKNAYETGIIGEAIDVFGDYIFSITSTGWTGTVTLQRSIDDWASYGTVQTFYDKETYQNTETNENAKYRINVTAHTIGVISSSLVVNTNAISGSATGVGVIKNPLNIKGGFDFSTNGNWDATVVLERNENNAGWEPYRTFRSKIIDGAGTKNVQFSATEESDNVQYRINVTNYTENGGTVYADLGVSDSMQSGIVRINNVVSDTSAEITVVSNIGQTADTIRWAEGAWSGVRGYPAAIGLYEERFIYGGTANNRNRIWLSAIGDYDNFEEGTKDSDSFSFDLPCTNAIKWISSLNTLIVGTGGEEFRIRATELDDALTPTNFNIRQQTPYGSSAIQAVEIGSVVLFVNYVGRKIRELVFKDSEQKYVAPDLAALAEHITLSGIVCFAHQKNPESILWCVLENGNLLTLSYEREQNVVAWARHPIDGLVQSVAVIPSLDEDEVWISVVRAVNGENKVYIEQFQSRTLDIRKENAFFVDSGIISQGALRTEIEGLGHLEGRTVEILADGEVLSPQKVVNNKITLATPARNVRAGLGYRSKAIPMRMDFNLVSGTTHGSIKKISEIVFSFHNTLNAKYGSSDTDLFDIDWTDPRWKNSSLVGGLFTGDITVAFDGGFDIDDTLIISQSDPLPCVVRAIIPRLEVTGR